MIAKKLISELSFISSQLDTLKAAITKAGAIDEFKQGKQEMLRESPATKTYCALIQRYGDLLMKLSNLLPRTKEAKDDEPAQEPEQQPGADLAAFIAKGKPT